MIPCGPEENVGEDGVGLESDGSNGLLHQCNYNAP
jgi:hypothetical protein